MNEYKVNMKQLIDKNKSEKEVLNSIKENENKIDNEL